MISERDPLRRCGEVAAIRHRELQLLDKLRSKGMTRESLQIVETYAVGLVGVRWMEKVLDAGVDLGKLGRAIERRVTT